MSKDGNSDSSEFGDGLTDVRIYRFGFRHALVVPALFAIFIALASVPFNVERSGDHAPLEPLAAVNKPHAYRPMPDQVSRTRAQASELSAHVRRYERQLFANLPDQNRESQRAESVRAITEIFAAVDRSNGRQMRKFLAAYKGDPVAKELGYLDAVARGLSERRLFRSDEIVACDQCWCWREAPPSVNVARATQ